jgi:hypothetical protein
MLNKIVLIVVALAWLNVPIAQTQYSPSALPFHLPEREEIAIEQVDVWSLGISCGPRILGSNAVSLENAYFAQPATFDSSWDDAEQSLLLQLSLRYALDRHIISGLSAGIKLDYTSARLSIDLKVTQGSVESYRFKGRLLSVDSLGLVPFLEIRGLSLIEALFRADLPEFWEIFVYGGPRINYNLYEKDKLDVSGMNNLVFGFEIGFGVEFFLSEHWSIRLQGASASNSTDLQVKQAGTDLFTGTLDLSTMRALFELCHYF